MNVSEVLASTRGSIVAPAGCGKTQLIISTLNTPQSKPILVLTHTTAGVAALKRRLRSFNVPSQNYVVTTIDGWSLRVASNFSYSCPIASSPDNGKYFYPEMRRVVHRYIVSGALNQTIKATYSRLLVDEYQDCNNDQHQLILLLANQLPTVVFGDPMQCIFDFGGSMPGWESDVLQEFPLLGTLTTPWRWNNSGSPQLGQWVLHAREVLMKGGKIDLQSCPNHVTWHPLSGDYQTDRTNYYQVQSTLLDLYPKDSLLVIGSSIDEQSRHDYAQGNARVEVVEQVQLAGVTKAAQDFDTKSGKLLAEILIEHASKMITGVDVTHTSKRINSILNGSNTVPPTPSEQALYNVAIDGTRTNILCALLRLEEKLGARVYRKAAFKALKDSISIAVSCPDISMFEAASIIRERLRQEGDRRVPRRAIGATLLLKGLEADHCLILNAQNRGMNAKHIYVALSRGAKSVTIFSNNQYIG